MDANRKMLEKQLEVMFDELAVAETEEEKVSITKRIETFYTLHQEDLKLDEEIEEKKDERSRGRKILDGVKAVGPYVCTVVVMCIGLCFEKNGTLVSPSFREARNRIIPRG